MPALSAAVTRIRTWVASATTKSTNHYTITAIELDICYVLQIYIMFRRTVYCTESLFLHFLQGYPLGQEKTFVDIELVSSVL